MRAPQVEVLYIVITETDHEINRITPYLLIQLEKQLSPAALSGHVWGVGR